MKQAKRALERRFIRFANAISYAAGTPWVFITAVALTILWAIMGVPVHFSDTWQLVMNTGSTISTGLMVFLIQATQNRMDAAVHVKLDEILRAIPRANNALIGIEHSNRRRERYERRRIREIAKKNQRYRRRLATTTRSR